MGSVALVITTRNNREALGISLRKALELAEAPPIVVVDNASTDGTDLMLRSQFPQVEVVRLPGDAGGAARNAGAARIPCEYVAFCRDDAMWTSGSLARAVEALDAFPRVGVISAKMLIGPGQHVAQQCSSMAASPSDRYPLGKPTLYFNADACVMRRGALFNCGGYDPRLQAGAEETLLALDLASRGYLLRYVEEIVVQQAAPAQTVLSQKARATTLRNQLWVAWLRHSSTAAWRATADVLARCPGDASARAALLRAITGLPWIVYERRPVNSRLQRQIDSFGCTS